MDMKKHISVCLTLSFVLYSFCAAKTDTPDDTQPQIQTISADPPVPKQDKISLTLLDSTGQSLTVESIEALAQLKPGPYKIKSWTIERTDDNGDTWQLKPRTARGEFTVIQGQTPKPDLADPITAALTVSKSSKGFYFDTKLKAQSGDNIVLYHSGKLSEPVLRIKNEPGTYDERFTFSYG
jgi:hypothetical protein